MIASPIGSSIQQSYILPAQNIAQPQPIYLVQMVPVPVPAQQIPQIPQTPLVPYERFIPPTPAPLKNLEEPRKVYQYFRHDPITQQIVPVQQYQITNIPVMSAVPYTTQ